MTPTTMKCAAPLGPILDVQTSVERYPGQCPTPKLSIRFVPGVPPRVRHAAMFKAAAAAELATPEREIWLVQAQHRGSCDLLVVTLELGHGDEDECARALAVLQRVAVARDWRPAPVVERPALTSAERIERRARELRRCSLVDLRELANKMRLKDWASAYRDKLADMIARAEEAEQAEEHVS